MVWESIVNGTTIPNIYSIMTQLVFISGNYTAKKDFNVGRIFGNAHLIDNFLV
jgi:hypothetical protein